MTVAVPRLTRSRCTTPHHNLRRKPTIFQLPREILDEIFLLASLPNSGEGMYHAYYFPMTISHVCRWWRQVSLSNGALWTNIIMALRDIPCTGTSLLSGAMTIASTWLSRSGSYPLNILLDLREPSWEPLDPDDDDWDDLPCDITLDDLTMIMSKILTLFLPHLPRWQHFELRSDTWAPIHQFLTHTQHLPSPSTLETVILRRCNAYMMKQGQSFRPSGSPSQPLPLFSHPEIPTSASAPLGLVGLKELSLSGVHLDWARSLPPSTLPSLHTLELKFHAADVMPSFSEFRLMLSHCTNLRSLSLCGWGPRPNFDGVREDQSTLGPSLLPAPDDKPIVLGNLTRFEWGLVNVGYAVELLAHLRMPRLTHLLLEDVQTFLWPNASLDVSPLLDALVRRSQATSAVPISLDRIETLELSNLHPDNLSHMRSFFTCLTHLASLHLTRCSQTLIFALQPYSALEYGSSKFLQSPCPSLRTLHCSRIDCSTQLGSSLFDVLSQRATAECPIQQIVCEHHDLATALTEREVEVLETLTGAHIEVFVNVLELDEADEVEVEEECAGYEEEAVGKAKHDSSFSSDEGYGSGSESEIIRLLQPTNSRESTSPS